MTARIQPLTEVVITPLLDDHSMHVRLLISSLLHICTNGARMVWVADQPELRRGKIAARVDL